MSPPTATCGSSGPLPHRTVLAEAAVVVTHAGQAACSIADTLAEEARTRPSAADRAEALLIG